MGTQTFSKFIRPAETDKGRISDRDLDILEAVLRCRFSPTSELVRLVGGNQDVTQRRLRKLWEWQLLNVLLFPASEPTPSFIIIWITGELWNYWLRTAGWPTFIPICWRSSGTTTKKI